MARPNGELSTGNLEILVMISVGRARRGAPHWRKKVDPKGIPLLSTSVVLVASLLNTFLGLSRTSELVLHSACVLLTPA